MQGEHLTIQNSPVVLHVKQKNGAKKEKSNMEPDFNDEH